MFNIQYLVTETYKLVFPNPRLWFYEETLQTPYLHNYSWTTFNKQDNKTAIGVFVVAYRWESGCLGEY